MAKKHKTAAAAGAAVRGSKAQKALMAFLGSIVDRMDRIETAIHALRMTKADEDRDQLTKSTQKRLAIQAQDQPQPEDHGPKFGGNWNFLTQKQASRGLDIVGASVPLSGYGGRQSKVQGNLAYHVPILTRRDVAYLVWAIRQQSTTDRKRDYTLHEKCCQYLRDANAKAKKQGCPAVKPGLYRVW